MDQFLILAYSLAILTYYLGVLIYALPIPWWGIKKWAPTLIYDALATAILIFMFSSIIELVNYLGSMLNIDWQLYFEWITGRIAIIGSFITTLMTFSMMLSSAGMKALSTAGLGPIISLATYTLIVLEILFILGLIFQQFFAKILVIGVLLYSVPFRITRGAGASLIAMSIIFTLALPLLPAFAEAFVVESAEKNISEVIEKIGSINVEEWGIVFVKGQILDKKGQPIAGALTKWYAKHSGGEDFVASYLTSEDGWFNAGRPYGGLPYNVLLRLEVIYCGVKLIPELETIDPHKDFIYDPLRDPNADYFITLKMKNAVIIDKYFIIKSSNPKILSSLKISKSEDEVKLKLNVSEESTLTIVVHEDYNADKIMINNTQAKSYDEVKSWGQINFYVYNIPLEEGSYEIKILINPEQRIRNPKISDKGYLKSLSGGISNLRDLGKTIASAIFEWIMLPITYLSILIMSTYSLAYVIGGRRVRLPIKT